MAVDDKTRVINQLEESYQGMLSAIEDLDPNLIVHPDSGWRLCDILGHIAAWKQERVNSLRAYQQGQEYRIPNFDPTRYNQRAYELRKNLPPEEIDAESKKAHADLIAILKTIPADQFGNEMLYPWGARGTITALAEIKIEHEREHLQEILKAAGRQAE